MIRHLPSDMPTGRNVVHHGGVVLMKRPLEPSTAINLRDRFLMIVDQGVVLGMLTLIDNQGDHHRHKALLVIARAPKVIYRGLRGEI